MSDGVFRKLLEEGAARAGVFLDERLLQKLEAYGELLARWNRRINLTSLPLEPPTEAAVHRLVIEPLTAIPYLSASRAVWFDLGSGGGSPAVPLQLAAPAKRLIMVESRERKAAFLREVIRELALPSSEVQASRIESVAADPRSAGIADLVSIRAVRIDAALFASLQALLTFGGQALLFTSNRDFDLPRGFELTPLGSSESSYHVFVVLRRVGL